MLNIGGGDPLATYSQCIGWPDCAPVGVDRLYVARSTRRLVAASPEAHPPPASRATNEEEAMAEPFLSEIRIMSFGYEPRR